MSLVYAPRMCLPMSGGAALNTSSKGMSSALLPRLRKPCKTETTPFCLKLLKGTREECQVLHYAYVQKMQSFNKTLIISLQLPGLCSLRLIGCDDSAALANARRRAAGGRRATPAHADTNPPATHPIWTSYAKPPAGNLLMTKWRRIANR